MDKEIRKQVKALENMRLPELWVRFTEVLGEETRAPNRTYLIRRITEGLEARAAETPDLAEIEPEVAPAEVEKAVESNANAADAIKATDAGSDEDAQPACETKLSKLPIAELQARYLEVVGRPTSSSHRRYLVWKIREAQRGRIPVGPRSRRRADGGSIDCKVLPLRMETDLVIQLDEARERLGLKSRMELFRRSLHAFLLEAGEVRVAELFAPSDSYAPEE